MPMVTNVSARLIHAGEVMLIPATPVEVSDDVLKGAVMQQYLDDGDIQMGEVKVKPEVQQDDEPEERPRAASPQASRPQTAPQPVKK